MLAFALPSMPSLFCRTGLPAQHLNQVPGTYDLPVSVRAALHNLHPDSTDVVVPCAMHDTLVSESVTQIVLLFYVGWALGYFLYKLLDLSKEDNW